MRIRYEVSLEDFDISDFTSEETSEILDIVQIPLDEIEYHTIKIGSYYIEFESQEAYEADQKFLSEKKLLEEISEYSNKRLCDWLLKNYKKYGGNFNIFCEEMEKEF